MVTISYIARNTALLCFLGIYVRANQEENEIAKPGPKPAYVKSDPVPIKWIPCKKIDLNATAQGRQAITAIAGGIGTIVAGLTAVFGLINGAVSAGNGIASLIKQGKDLAEMFGISKKENAILIDHKCKESDCKLRIRCYSLLEDMGWFDIDPPDGVILKFTTYLPNGTPLNIGVTNWKCDYEDAKNHKLVTKDAFGYSAPRQLFNLFEARDKGIWTMDKETGRIDIRQKVAFW